MNVARIPLVLACLSCAAAGQIVGPFTFDSADQFINNFRVTSGTSAPATQATSDGNGYVSITNTASNPWIGYYDPTASVLEDALPTFSGAFTLRLEISAGDAVSSFGLFLFDTANPNGNNLLTVFNLDTTVASIAGREQIRFWKDSTILGGAVANAYTSGITGTGGAFDSASNSWASTDNAALTISTVSPYTFYTLDLTYDPTARTFKVATTGFSATLNIPAGDIISNPGIAVRVNDAGQNNANTAKIDGFAVIPEPTSTTLLATGGLLFGVRRRRE